MQFTRAPVAATVGPLGPDTLERLSHLDTHGRPVLSVYLDLDPERFPTPDARDTQLGSLFDEGRREGAAREVDRVRAWLDADGAIRRGARGLAVFCCAKAGVLEAVRLTTPVEPLAVVDTVPWLEPLAAMISPGDWGVAVVRRRAARLLRGGAAALAEFASIDHELHRRHAQGGWSQARFQRGVEEQAAAHVRAVAERLLRAHLHRRFGRLVIVCSAELRPVVERSLHGELKEVLVGTVDADLERAPAEEIGRAVAPLIGQAERDRERDLVARLEQALGTGGAAAAGLDDVVSALEQQRVENLLVAEGPSLKTGLCPTCGRLSTDGGRSCPLDGATLVEVDATEHAIERAARQSAQVVVVRYERDWLHEHGDIAALLRW